MALSSERIEAKANNQWIAGPVTISPADPETIYRQRTFSVVVDWPREKVGIHDVSRYPVRTLGIKNAIEVLLVVFRLNGSYVVALLNECHGRIMEINESIVRELLVIDLER